jgi:hypothetical protein
MKYFVTAGIVVVMASLVVSNCYAGALWHNSNGNDWNKATDREKEPWCKELAFALSKLSPPKTGDYTFWMRNLDHFCSYSSPKLRELDMNQAVNFIHSALKSRHQLGD